MPRPRHYGSAAAKQRAYRRRRQFQASGTGKLIALQDAAAEEHVVPCMRLLQLAPQATADQRHLQAELQERDMLDALWVLQTLISDFGFDAVDTHVLQHLRRTPCPQRQAAPP